MQLPMANRSFLVLAGLWLLCCAAIAQDISSPTQKQVAEFSVEKGGEPLLLPVTFNGVSRHFVVDSGASIHVLDTRFQTSLGKRITTLQARTSGGSVPVNLFPSPELHVGELAVKDDRPIATLDITRVTEALGREVHGILVLCPS